MSDFFDKIGRRWSKTPSTGSSSRPTDDRSTSPTFSTGKVKPKTIFVYQLKPLLWHQGRQSIDSRRHMDSRQSMDYGSSPFAAMPPPEQINDMFEQMLASILLQVLKDTITHMEQ